MLKKIKHSAQHSLDWYFFGGVIFLLLLGLLAVYDSSSAKALADYGNQFHFLENQILWIVLGSLGAAVLYLMDYRKLKRLALPLFILAALVVLEKDLGTAVIITAIGLACFFFAKASFRQILLTLLIFGLGGLGLALQSSTFRERWDVFLHPDTDPQGTGYQTRQIKITLGSGGFWGLGIGRSRQKYGYIPDIHTDAIFAVVGEE